MVAIVTTNTIAPGALNIPGAIINAMSEMGIQIENQSSNSMVFKLDLSSKATGIIYLNVLVDDYGESLRVFQRLQDRSTESIYQSVNSSQVFFNPSQSISIKTINHTSAKLIQLTQQNFVATLGYIRPNNNPPDWWNEDMYPYCFIPMFPSGRTLVGFDGWHPFANNSSQGYYSFPQFPQVNNPNPITGKRSILAGIPLFSDIDIGAIAVMPQDFILASGAGLQPGDEIVDGTKSYLLLTNDASAIGVRIS